MKLLEKNETYKGEDKLKDEDRLRISFVEECTEDPSCEDKP